MNSTPVPADGIYKGHWVGYCVVFETGSHMYKGHASTGRANNVSCIVTVKNGTVSVETEESFFKRRDHFQKENS